jgi:hypothetical protein
MDNDVCDGDGQVIVIRWSATVIENDSQCLSGPVVCQPFAPVTVLPYKRRGFQVIYGDEKAKTYQHRIILGQPLP